MKMEDQKEVEDQKTIEVVGDTYLQGCFSGRHYTRSKYKCPNCHHRHVAVEDGLGRDFPISIQAICESCGAKLVIRGWNSTD